MVDKEDVWVDITKLAPSAISDICLKFFKSFRKGEDYVYYNKILALEFSGTTTLIVDYIDIESMISNPIFDKTEQQLPIFMVADPTEVMSAFQNAVYRLLGEVKEAYANKVRDKLQVRIKNMPQEIEIPDMRSDLINKMICVNGIVNMIEQPSTLITRAVYICNDCGTKNEAAETRTLFHKPRSKCENCQKTNLDFAPELSEHTTYQRISIQQLHDKVEPGAIAADSEAWLIGTDLINVVMPGERVKITGFVRLKPKLMKNVNSLFDFYIEVSSIQNLHEEEISDEDEKLQSLVSKAIRPDSEEKDFMKLVTSLCPSIKGEEEIKAALLLQSVSSEAMILQDGSRVRGDLNILLCGDPGSGKTTLMRYVKKLHKRAVYVTGRGFSRAGLTAAVIREGNGLPRIMAGAYMLADKGIAIIDEVEKTEKEDREVLPNLMDDQQIFNLSKFGMNKDLAIRTASLHGCNPLSGKYDVTKTLGENLQFALWLFDRYDLKFVMRNEANAEKDMEISSHFSKMIMQSVSEKNIERKKKELVPLIDTYSNQFMKAWIAYVKKNYDPQLTDESINAIQKFYLDLRKDDETKEVTMREMGALIRLARASARAHMRNEVLIKDVEIGIDLILHSMKSCGIDPDTGKFNYRIMSPTILKRTSGHTTQVLRRLCEELDGQTNTVFSESEVIEKMKADGFKRSDVVQALYALHAAGKLYSPRPGIFQISWDAWSRK